MVAQIIVSILPYRRYMALTHTVRPHSKESHSLEAFSDALYGEPHCSETGHNFLGTYSYNINLFCIYK